MGVAEEYGFWGGKDDENVLNLLVSKGVALPRAYTKLR